MSKKMTHKENSNYVIEKLQSLGFDVNSSRLKQMHKAVHDGYHEFGTDGFWSLLQAHRDLVQIGFALNLLEDHKFDDENSKKYMEIVKKLLKDNLFPQDDRGNSKGRDTQFELYLAAVCQKAKLFPVGFDEPDVMCYVDGSPFCIAAKRIKHLQNAHQRIKKAADQIIKQQRPGIIALDMSIAFNRDNHSIHSPLENQMLELIISTQVNQLFNNERLDKIQSHCSGKGVLAVVVFSFWSQFIDGAWKQHRSAQWIELDGNSDEESRIYKNFYDRFIAVVPNIE